MSSKIEQLIDEMEEYIDNCKYKAFSTDVIMVNKAEIDDLLRELRMKTPEEIKSCQKIIQNREAIIEDAKQKAQKLLNDAALQTNELISEHQIMQQAYAQAESIITASTNKAQEILDKATIEANTVKESVMRYTDTMLANLENIVKQSIELTTKDSQTLLNNLMEIDHVVTANRAELVPEVIEETVSGDGTDKLDVI